ncbi:MAG: glycoside hydrolase family 57 protein [Candidatus Omnitrophota bacterium]
MLYLAFIFHMHQPYYKNLLTQQTDLPWVRLHGVKDYLDMVRILENYPDIRQTFNLVPSLIEQIQDYASKKVKDRYLELSYCPASELTVQEKQFILANFFSINTEKCIAVHPRYYELFLKRENNRELNTQDYLDLQVWFNLSWIDSYFRDNIKDLKKIVSKARFFTEREKIIVLEKQLEIINNIIPAYKEFSNKGQIEITLSPYYHPILPLLCNTEIAKEANSKTILPQINFSYPEDAGIQIEQAIKFFKSVFGFIPSGMWPSEAAVSRQILPFIERAGIKWIITDEAILFKSLKTKKRSAQFLYKPYIIKTEEGSLNIIFRDRMLSDLIGFVYHRWNAQDAVNDFMKQLKNIYTDFKNRDLLVTIAMDGENAWEYYSNDGKDFLGLLYKRLSESEFIKTTTVNEYLKTHPAKDEIKQLSAGSWIYGEFNKWIGSPQKNKAWEQLIKARRALNEAKLKDDRLVLAWKQMLILEGSDWFWWYGDDTLGDFDRLFRMHLANFYSILGARMPDF